MVGSIVSLVFLFSLCFATFIEALQVSQPCTVYCADQCYAVQCISVQCSAVQSAVQCSAVQSAVQCRVQCSAECNSMHRSAECSVVNYIDLKESVPHMYSFSLTWPLGRVSYRVKMSVCMCVPSRLILDYAKTVSLLLSHL